MLNKKRMEINESKFKLKDIRKTRLETRTIGNSFDLEKFKEVAEAKGLAITKVVIEEAKATIEDFYFRGYDLIVFIFINNLLAISIFLYIKKLGKK
ncbi:MAG: hypothetical protein ACK4G1_01165 [Ignavibacteria bacterium]